jgi:hypothetical protein
VVKRVATFDSSFWIHAVYLDLVDFLLEDFELICAKEVERELGRDNPTSRRLKGLFADKQIHSASARSVKIKLYGDGERAAINLALERDILYSSMTGSLSRPRAQPGWKSSTRCRTLCNFIDSNGSQ